MEFERENAKLAQSKPQFRHSWCHSSGRFLQAAGLIELCCRWTECKVQKHTIHQSDGKHSLMMTLHWNGTAVCTRCVCSSKRVCTISTRHQHFLLWENNRLFASTESWINFLCPRLRAELNLSSHTHTYDGLQALDLGSQEALLQGLRVDSSGAFVGWGVSALRREPNAKELRTLGVRQVFRGHRIQSQAEHCRNTTISWESRAWLDVFVLPDEEPWRNL